MCNNKRIVVMDLDGTIFDDFFEVDRKIIEQIFNFNKFVLVIASGARSINNLGFIKNTTNMLKLRLFIYNLFIKKRFRQVLSEYKTNYIRFVYEALNRNSCHIDMLEKEKFDIVILSNNKYSATLSTKYNIITVKSKISKLRELSKRYGDKLIFVVGDNYFDDIFPARKLKIANIYLTCKHVSEFKKNRARKKKRYYCKNLIAAIDILKYQ